MLRLVAKLKGFRPRVSVLWPPCHICNENSSLAVLALPAPVSAEPFVEEMQPVAIPELRKRQPANKATIADYLKGDPHRLEVMVPKEIELHRKLVMNQLGENRWRQRGKTHALILAGSKSHPRYPFRQSCDFLYICDCLLPGVVLFLLRNRQRELHCILFCPQEYELDPQECCKRFHVDEVLPMSHIAETLQQKLHYVSAKLWYSKDRSPLSKLITELASQFKLPIDCPRYLMEYVRSFKSEREMAAIRRANAIAADSLQELIAEHLPQQEKRELGLLFAQKCRERHAHQPLPYEPKLVPGIGNVYLMDASCQYAGYYGGLARYWPIHGRFTPTQKVLYNMLLDMRAKLCLLICKTESVVWSPQQAHTAYLMLLAEHLQELRVLPSNLNRAAEFFQAVANFNCSPTSVTHVGLDFAGDSGKLINCPLMPGHVISLQLSIMIPNDCLQAYPEFRGVLCVINDCIYVKSKNELEVLSANCVSYGRDIEDLRDCSKNLRSLAN